MRDLYSWVLRSLPDQNWFRCDIFGKQNLKKNTYHFCIRLYESFWRYLYAAFKIKNSISRKKYFFSDYWYFFYEFVNNFAESLLSFIFITYSCIYLPVYLGCVRVRHPSSSSMDGIHGWHPRMTLPSMDDISPSMDDIHGWHFSIHGWQFSIHGWHLFIHG